MIGVLLGASSQPTLPGPTHPWWYGDAAAGFSADEPGITKDTSIQIPTVYACVRVLAESVASLPLILYRRNADGSKERATDHRLYDVLHDSPTPWNTSVEFFEAGMYQLALRGNMLAWKTDGGDGVLDSLNLLNPDEVSKVEIEGSRLRYTINGKPHYGDELLHVRGMSSDGVWGLSPVGHMRRTLELTAAAERFGERYLRSGIRPAGALQFPNPLSDKAYDRLKQSINAEHAGNQHRAMILEEGGTWSPITIAPEEAQFLETRQFQVAEIARMFRVPPHMVQDLTHATFSNIEHQGIDFVVHTLRPWLTRLEKAIQRDLIYEDGLFCEFLADALMRGDTASRYQAYATGLQNEFLNPNEVRGFENLNPRDGGDEYKNPAINPQKTEKPSDPPPGAVQAHHIASRFAKNIAGRVASRELKELEKRAKHAKSDSHRWGEWLTEFYDGHAKYVDEQVDDLCDVMQMQASKRAEMVSNLVSSSLQAMQGGDPEKTVAEWSHNESRAAFYARAITESVL